MSRLSGRYRGLWLWLGVLLAACTAESKIGPESGMVHVTLATTGQDLDPDGYSVLVNGVAKGHLADQADTTLIGVPTGSGSVSLTGMASNCTSQQALPLTVNVPANEAIDVAVTVHCAATTAFLRMTVEVAGYDQDPDGFIASIDGGSGVVVTAPGKVVPIGAGDHSVSLSGLASNCSLDPVPATQAFYVAGGDTAVVDFAIGCTAITGSIQVTTSTTGALPDPDGYLVSVGSGAAVHMGINETHLFAGLAPGNYLIQITGIAVNCTQYMPDQVSATVGASGFPLVVTLPVDCPEVGTLRVETPLIPQVPNGYELFMGAWDGAYPIGATDTTVIPNVWVGSQQFSIRMVEGGCIPSPSMGTVTILANQVTDLKIDCPPVGTLRVETPVVSGAGNNFVIGFTDGVSVYAAYALGAADTTVIVQLAAQTYQYVIWVPAGCTATPSEGSLTITSFGVTDLNVGLTCPAASAVRLVPHGASRVRAVKAIRRSD